jgi:uncharacterized protein with PIN domain/molybdopterin converting factor small subunit
MVTATFRFYAELNDFLAPEKRGREFSSPCARAATAKHMIEALGVPHTEVDLVLINGESANFDQLLKDGARVAIFPRFRMLDVSPLLRITPFPSGNIRFIADAHLGGLAPLLRMAGFDTLYDNHFQDSQIEDIARLEKRIVLTRDRELLKRRSVIHGCYMREIKPAHQLLEIFARLSLARHATPFTLCLECNAPLRSTGKGEVLERLPPSVRERFDRFSTCDLCGRVFWEGSHWQRMRKLLDRAMSAS